MQNDIRDLNDRIEALTARVAALEASHAGGHHQPPRHAPEPSEAIPTTGADDPDMFWALNGLAERRGQSPETEQGVVMMVGSLDLPSGAPVAWQYGAGTDGLIDLPWDERAGALAALGHPARLEILRHLLQGVSTTADLAALESLGTTGQLHHHMRQLVATGWVQQRTRGTYEVPAPRVVPLLLSIVGAQR